MDRRSYERKHLRHAATLHAPRSGALVATMRDLSLGGMYVETGPAGLPQNSAVKVSFALPDSGSHESFTLEAVVVRRGRDGSGLMFVRMEQDVIRALSDALSRYGAVAATGSSRATR
jgi:hypothetical protein